MSEIEIKQQVIFTPHPKQQEFIDVVFSGKYDVLIFGGAKGGGKTSINLVILILLCRFYPGSRWIVLRESYTELELNTVTSLHKVLPSNFLKRKTTDPSGIHYRMINGSEIILMSEAFNADKDRNRFNGLEINGVLFEQIEEAAYETYDAVIPAIGRNKIDPMPPALTLATINPTMAWPRKMFYEKWLNGTLPERTLYMPSKIKDNPTFFEDKEYMKRLDSMDAISRERLIEGNWDAWNFENAWIYSFEYQKHVKEPYKLDVTKPVYLSFDFNVNPMTCILRQGDLTNYRIIKEFKTKNVGTDKFVEEIIRYLPPKRTIFVTGDPTGKNRNVASQGLKSNYKIIIGKLILAGHAARENVMTAHPSHDHLRSIVNLFFDHFPDISISLECENLINDLQFIKANDKGDRDKNKELKEGKGHLLDCLLYDIFTFYKKWVENLAGK